MAIKIRKRAAADVSAPTRTDVVDVFVDSDDVIKFKDSRGVVRTAVAVTGTPISLAKQASAPASEEDKDKLYAKTVTDLEVFVRDSAGNEVQLTNEGGPAASGGVGGVWWQSSNTVKVDTGTILGTETYSLVFPEPLAPPPGVRSLYVVELRFVSEREGGGTDFGGDEVGIELVFQEGPGTPDARLGSGVYAGTGYFRWSNGVGGPIRPLVNEELDVTVDASGVLTFVFTNDEFTRGVAKIAANCSGPFVFPSISVTEV